ncbi:putative secreted protein [Rhodopirellula sallentina SM41]|uniref:Putative secreted protein n=2 Tax=Rhodopirellula TaxID=265488 RepID=M5TZG9_9BACT|nr:putative secreted protein [Rhodopirellula sallentina SM41]
MAKRLKTITWILCAMVLLIWQLAFASPTSAQEVADPAQPTAEDPAEKKSSAEKAASEEANPADETEKLYVRIQRDEDNDPLAMQTATVRYVGKPGTKYAGKIVDLVGVVHIGQAEYYEALKTQLAGYDKVLYELVAPDGTRIRPEDLQKRRSLLASMQTGMKDMLNLEYQLEKIDYMAENFRHADMSPDEFAEDLARRGDSVWKMVARMMGAGLASQSANSEAGLLLALFSKDRSKMLKRAMAGQLIDIEMVSAGLDDSNGENTLIKGRNRKAFEILKEELDGETQTAAVFYGAGHLPDMADRLINEFEMEPTQTTWLDAWDLTRN